MKKAYNVHSAVAAKTPKMVKLADGGEAEVMVDSFESQLVPEDALSGTIKVVFTGAAAAEAAKLFVMGKSVSVAFGE